MTQKPVVPLTAEEMVIVFRAMRHLSNALSVLGNADEFPLRPNPRPHLWHASEALNAVMGYQMRDNHDAIDEAHRLADTAEMPERVEWQRYPKKPKAGDTPWLISAEEADRFRHAIPKEEP